MAGVRQGPITDALVRPPTRAFHQLVQRSDTVWIRLITTLLPDLITLGGPVRFGIAPTSDKVWEVREAQAAFGLDIPALAHHDRRARQRARVFQEGRPPPTTG